MRKDTEEAQFTYMQDSMKSTFLLTFGKRGGTVADRALSNRAPVRHTACCRVAGELMVHGGDGAGETHRAADAVALGDLALAADPFPRPAADLDAEFDVEGRLGSL